MVKKTEAEKKKAKRDEDMKKRTNQKENKKDEMKEERELRRERTLKRKKKRKNRRRKTLEDIRKGGRKREIKMTGKKWSW